MRTAISTCWSIPAERTLRSLLSLGALYCDLEAALQKPIDLITVSALEQRAQMPSEEMFRETVMKEKLNVYDAA